MVIQVTADDGENSDIMDFDHETPQHKRALLPFVIAVDTREQSPFHFTGFWWREKLMVCTTQTMTLATGDYSIVDDPRIVIERKSKADLYGTLGKGRERFEREFERMQLLERSAVVVESSWEDTVNNPPRDSHLSPQSVEGTVLAWSIRYPKTHWYFGNDKRNTEWITLRLLMAWHGEQERAAKTAADSAKQ